MAMVVRGLLLVIAHGRAVLNLPSSFTVIGQGRLFGVQYPIFVMLSLVIVGEILVRNARFFRQSYYIGGNERAARLSGINVDLVKIFNYCLVAVLAGVAGLLITGPLWLGLRHRSASGLRAAGHHGGDHRRGEPQRR